MNIASVLMGLADLICITVILLTFGINFLTGILAIVMIPKGVMSFF